MLAIFSSSFARYPPPPFPFTRWYFLLFLAIDPLAIFLFFLLAVPRLIPPGLVRIRIPNAFFSYFPFPSGSDIFRGSIQSFELLPTSFPGFFGKWTATDTRVGVLFSPLPPPDRFFLEPFLLRNPNSRNIYVFAGLRQSTSVLIHRDLMDFSFFSLFFSSWVFLAFRIKCP